MSTTPIIPGMSSLTQTYYTQLIDALMTTERKPLARVESQQSALKSMLEAYKALDSKFSALNGAVDGLLSAPSSVWNSRVASVVSKSIAEANILTATADRSAAVGDYVIEVSALAQAHRVVSDRQTSATAALGLQGEFYVGGAESRTVEGAVAGPGVAAFGVTEPAQGQTELGRGSYFVEMRDHQGTMQFRIVDGHGAAVTVADSSATDMVRMTSGWQDLSLVAGTTYDTGRGLTVTFAPFVDHAVSDPALVPGTVDGFATSRVREGQVELEDGVYYVEIRENVAGSGDWEFRLVDSAGQSASIYDAASADGSFTAEWQDIGDALALSQGAFETGRGLSIDFGEGSYTEGTMGSGAASVTYSARSVQPARMADGAASVDYVAQGAEIAVTADDSLSAIAEAINSAGYPAGDGVSATVIGQRLVLTARSTGAANTIVVSNSEVLQSLGLITAAGDYKNTALEGEPGYVGYRMATDAQFTVNGVSVSSASNTGISTVITGVTLNLAEDAVGKSAKVAISMDSDSIVSKVKSFVSAFNALQAAIKIQTGVTVTGSGEDVSYSRNTLSGDAMLRSLRTRLYTLFGQQPSGLPTGAPANLREIGITLDANLEAKITDESALQAALAADPAGVEALLNSVMRSFKEALTPFRGDSGILQMHINQANGRLTALAQRAKTMEERLARRQQYYVQQFAYLQVQLAQMSYTKQRLSTFWGFAGQDEMI